MTQPLPEILLKWEAEAIRQRFAANGDALFSVESIIKLFMGLGGDSALQTHWLLTSLQQQLSAQDLVSALKGVLEQDPTLTGPPFLAGREVLEEKPFPRYLVSVVYLIVLQNPEESFPGLGEALWKNIFGAKRNFYANFLGPILDRFFSKEVLTVRSREKLKEGNEHAAFIANQILYGLKGRR